MQVIKQISAGGIVCKKINSKTLWLICQHSQHQGWVFPKGLVGDTKENEVMEEAALREVEEEGGVKAKIVNPQPLKTGYKYPGQGKLIVKTVYYFLMEYVSGDPKNHDWEMKDSKFVTQEEVLNTLDYQSDIAAFKKILRTI